MLTAVITRSFPATGSYKVNINDFETDEEFNAVALLPFKGVDGESSIRYVFEVGCSVLVTQIRNGAYCILGCLPFSSERTDSDGVSKATKYQTPLNTRVGEFASVISDSVYNKAGEENYCGFEQTEVIPGDITLKASGGAAVRILRGGSSVLDADTARVIANKSTSSLDLDCSRYRCRTALGDLVVEDNPSGDYFLDFRGNTDPNASSTNFKVRLEGAGENPTLSLSLGDGYGFSINAAGEMTIKASKIYHDNGDSITELGYSGTSGVKEENGDVSITSVDTKLESEATTQINSKGSLKVGTSGEVTDSCGPFRSTTTRGPSIFQTPLLSISPDLVKTRKDITTSGSHAVELGSITSGGGSYSVSTNAGDIKLETKTAASPLINGSVLLSTTSPYGRTGGTYGITLDSSKTVVGGGFGTVEGLPSVQSAFLPVPGGLNPIMSGLCKFEALFMYVTALHALLDTHVHGVAPSPVMSPVGVPIGITAGGITLPTPVFSAGLFALATRIESQQAWNLGL